MSLVIRWAKDIFRNPLASIYVLIRISIRVILGRKRRDLILKKVGWERLEKFLSMLPPNIVFALTVKYTVLSISRKVLRHEPKVSNLLEQTSGNLFIDIGANHGYYTFLLSPRYKEIWAVEPHPDNIRVIHTVKNKLQVGNVKILQIAVGEYNGQARLFIGKHSGGHSLLDTGTGKTITVTCKTLSSIAKNKEIDLVKVDVEGAEWLVLKGAEPIMQNIKSWLIELHDPSRKKQLEEWMRRYGYKTIWIDRNHIYARRRDVDR